MQEFQGFPVSPGVAIAQALLLDREGYQITRSRVTLSERASEAERLDKAFAAASEQFTKRTSEASEKQLNDLQGIFSAQQQLLLDPRLREEMRQLILRRSFSAQLAVSQVLNGYAQAFRRMGGTFLAERVADIRDIERALLEQLGGAPTTSLANLQNPVILFSHDLTPSETANLDKKLVLGFCTEVGGPGGHTAIVARGMEIPAVVGVGSFAQQIRGGMEVILDGYRGRVILEPDPQIKENYLRRSRDRQNFAISLDALRDLPAVTLDQKRIELLANIEFPSEVTAAMARGAEGIGLYRTEFLYLGGQEDPSEQQQFEAYCRVLKDVHGGQVIIRTLDLGADKLSSRQTNESEANPFLGLRSIRYCLRNPSVFRIQLRAMLRASVEGDLRIMFPMIATLNELRSARLLVRSVMDDLREEGYAVGADVKIGMMVEVPAAVMMLDRFVREVDFISIGTNDLTQYTLAVDRGNEAVADLYQAVDPSVLRLISQSVKVAEQAGIATSVCGEMSSHPAYALLLIGMGVRTLSAPPGALPQLKKAIRSVSLSQCQAIAERALRLETAQQIHTAVHDSFAALLPDMVQQI
jgi:phosphotransferase system enzyme I (PtsI)